jgi:hypothetical protein
MRKYISIILLFSIGASSSGFTLSKHFCGDDLADVQLNQVVNSCCSDPGEMPDDCCHNELDQALLDSYSLDVNIQIIPVFFLLADNLLADGLFFYLTEANNSDFQTAYHSPPVPNPDVYLWVQSFLI